MRICYVLILGLWCCYTGFSQPGVGKQSIPGDYGIFNLRGHNGEIKLLSYVIVIDGTSAKKLTLEGNSLQGGMTIKCTEPELTYQLNIRISDLVWNDNFQGDLIFSEIDLKGAPQLKLKSKPCFFIEPKDQANPKATVEFEIIGAGSGELRMGYFLDLGKACADVKKERWFVVNYKVEMAKPEPKVEKEVMVSPEVKVEDTVEEQPPPPPPIVSRDSEPKKEEDLEKKAWERAEDKDTEEAYVAFLKAYKDSERYAEKANERILPLGYDLNDPEPQVRTVLLINAVQPQIVDYSEGLVILEDRLEDGFLKVRLPDNENVFFIEILDTGKAKDLETRLRKIALKNIFQVVDVVAPDDPEGDWIVQMKGGEKPYQIFFRNSGGVIQNNPRFPQVEKEAFNITKQKLEELPDGDQYTFIIQDKFGQQDADLESPVIDIPKKELPLKWIGIGIGVFILFFVISRLRSSYKRRKYKRLQAEREKQKAKEEPEKLEKSKEQEATIIDFPSNAPAPAVPKPAPPKEVPMMKEPAASGTTGKFRIKSRRRHSYEVEQLTGQLFYAQLVPQEFYRLRIDQMWKDSVVHSVFLKKSSIYELDHYVRDQGISTFAEDENQIPEIGGLLMGKVAYDRSKDHYLVAIEKFEPIEATSQDEISLEFSNQSLARVFSKFEDNHPDMALLGWFHTHPGHGLFLSKPDLRIQEGFFTRPYQFAMEMDSKSENLDTGFFTWKKGNKGINNVRFPKQGNDWYAWTEIEKFMRR